MHIALYTHTFLYLYLPYLSRHHVSQAHARANNTRARPARHRLHGLAVRRGAVHGRAVHNRRGRTVTVCRGRGICAAPSVARTTPWRRTHSRAPPPRFGRSSDHRCGHRQRQGPWLRARVSSHGPLTRAHKACLEPGCQPPRWARRGYSPRRRRERDQHSRARRPGRSREQQPLGRHSTCRRSCARAVSDERANELAALLL